MLSATGYEILKHAVCKLLCSCSAWKGNCHRYYIFGVSKQDTLTQIIQSAAFNEATVQL